MGELTGERREGEGEGRAGRSCWGVLGGRAGCSAMAPLFGLLATVREKKGERRKEKRRERKEKKKGRKKMKRKKGFFFPNLEIFGKR
jgi:hypothetical protein